MFGAQMPGDFEAQPFGGYRVIVRPPVAIYRRSTMVKRHRKKRWHFPRVKRFVRYEDQLNDETILDDRINKVFYMNQRNYERLRERIGAEG